jgi:hypothetical protein
VFFPPYLSFYSGFSTRRAKLVIFAICLLNPSKDSAPAALQGLLAPVREAARVQAATCPPVLSELSVHYRRSTFHEQRPGPIPNLVKT